MTSIIVSKVATPAEEITGWPPKVVICPNDGCSFNKSIIFFWAILGVNKEIQTLSGKVKIKIDPGTQSAKILRLKGKGLPSIERYGTGDFLIHINVWTPQELTKEQHQFFENMKDDENFTPSPKNSDKSFFEKVKDMFS